MRIDECNIIIIKYEIKSKTCLLTWFIWMTIAWRVSTGMKKVVLKGGKQVKLNCKDKLLFESGVQAFAKMTPLQLSAYSGF